MSIATAARSTRPSRMDSAAAAPDLALQIALAWLVLGCLGLLAVPALRGSSAWFGWLPFWLVLMPATECLLLRWRPLLTASRTTLARVRRHGRALSGSRRNRRACSNVRSGRSLSCVKESLKKRDSLFRDSSSR